MNNELWNLILSLKYKVATLKGELRYCHLRTSGEISFNHLLTDPGAGKDVLIVFHPFEHPDLQGAALMWIKNHFVAEIIKKGKLEEEEFLFLQIYLPYCFLSFLAKEKGRAIAVAHFAQSLDGRIATQTGDSKWIGNQENLVHAHRMRALCDAILIGSGTLERDKPKLTVRYVKGQNPTRVIVGLSCTDFSCLQESCPNPVIVIGATPNALNGTIDYLCIPKEKKRIKSASILTSLYKKGLHTVYLEGGPTTTSYFLEDGTIDILQLHLSPMILGSGKSAIVLPDIEKLSRAIRFEDFCFQKVGNTVMFVGQPG